MAYKDFRPTEVTAAGSGWVNVSQVLDSLGYAELQASSTSSFKLRKFDFHDLPKDIQIDGVEILVDSYVASGATGTPSITLYYYTISSLNKSENKVSDTITGGATTLTLGGSADLWDFELLYSELNSSTSGFSLHVGPTAAIDQILYLRNIRLRLHYTQKEHLVGNRSKFSFKTRNWQNVGFDGGKQFDVNMAGGVANDSTSFIKRKFNSADPSSQVKSEDVNLLGDALYNIEYSILNNDESVRANLGSKLYIFSITVTGTVAGSGSIGEFARVRRNSSYSYAQQGLNNIGRIKMPSVNARISCHFTSAVAWVTSGATTSALYVQPHGFFVQPSPGYYPGGPDSGDYWLSFDLLHEDFYNTIVNYENYAPSAGAFDSHQGSYLQPKNLTSGNVFVKLLAIGVET
jgi:hypothetical protein